MSDKSDNVVQFPDTNTLDAEAAEWVVRLDSESVTADDLRKFREWQNASPHHREIAARLGRLWSDLDKLEDLAEPVNLGASVGRVDARESAFRRMRPFLYAAACFVAAIAGIPIYNSLRTAPPVVVDYQTSVGAQRTVSLPDGSTAYLNTNSLIEAEFTDRTRKVRLVRGEVYFEVAHDERRPFTVSAAHGLVRDVGTAFDLRLIGQAIDVTVTQGSVELATTVSGQQPNAAAEQHLATLAAGQKAVFDRKVQRLALVSDAAINRQLAWRQGVLIYAGEPLSQVVADFGRYTNTSVEIKDPKLRGVQVGGYFEIGKIDTFLDALRSNFGIVALWRDPGHVELVSIRRRSAEGNAR
jgi:transmembrane sensor